MDVGFDVHFHQPGIVFYSNNLPDGDNYHVDRELTHRMIFSSK